MRSQQFIASLAYTPSSAWAARPLASGAPSMLVDRRSVRCLGLGCPSFGGQRTGRVTATGMGALLPGFSNQTARSAVSRAAGCSFRTRGAVADLCTGRAVAFGSRPEAEAPRAGRVQTASLATVGAPWHRLMVRSFRAGLTETAKFHTPVRQSRAPAVLGAKPQSARSSRAGWRASVGCPSEPNHSVKGTSCGRPQAAPYLER